MKLTKEEKIIRAFGKRVRQLRKEQGLSMEDLAEKAGFSYNQLSRIELGEINTSLVNVVKLAEALECKMNDFFDF